MSRNIKSKVKIKLKLKSKVKRNEHRFKYSVRDTGIDSGEQVIRSTKLGRIRRLTGQETDFFKAGITEM